MKRKVAVLILLILIAFIGYDRHQMQKKILALEYQNAEQKLSLDMLKYRINHPFHPNLSDTGKGTN